MCYACVYRFIAQRYLRTFANRLSVMQAGFICSVGECRLKGVHRFDRPVYCIYHNGMYSIQSGNVLYYGDNLTIMKSMPSNSIDLIYLDPPFKSEGTYNLLYKNATGLPVPEQAEAFCDTWELDAEKLDMVYKMPSVLREYGMDDDIVQFWQTWMTSLKSTQPKLLAYLIYMFYRLLEMRRALKDTGSIYLHCDPTASHYIKVLMDGVFGHDYFHNEIIWKSAPNKNDPKKRRFANRINNILFYSKTENYYYNPVYSELDADYIKKTYTHEDKRGMYMTSPLYCNTSAGGYGKQKVFEFNGLSKRWMYAKSTLQTFLENDLIHVTGTGGMRKKTYLQDSKGKPVSNLWNDIDFVQGREDLGYPTQKPVELLDRIIKASCPPNGVVFDPFCGCGTSIYASIDNQRKWVGCDIAILAIKLIQETVEQRYGLRDTEHYNIDGIPISEEQARELFAKDPFQFQHWAVELAGGFCNLKKTGDRGVDGVIYYEIINDRGARELQKVIVSVKGGHLRPTDIRDLHGTLASNIDAEMGAFICLEKPTKQQREAAAAAGTFEYQGTTYNRIQIRTIAELLDNRPFDTPTKVRLIHKEKQYGLRL